MNKARKRNRSNWNINEQGGGGVGFESLWTWTDANFEVDIAFNIYISVFGIF